jgi:hypothetical protein
MAQADQTLSKVVFVGERRSPRAIGMKVTWQDGRLAAKTFRKHSQRWAYPEGAVES